MSAGRPAALTASACLLPSPVQGGRADRKPGPDASRVGSSALVPRGLGGRRRFAASGPGPTHGLLVRVGSSHVSPLRNLQAHRGLFLFHCCEMSQESSSGLFPGRAACESALLAWVHSCGRGDQSLQDGVAVSGPQRECGQAPGDLRPHRRPCFLHSPGRSFLGPRRGQSRENARTRMPLALTDTLTPSRSMAPSSLQRRPTLGHLAHSPMRGSYPLPDGLCSGRTQAGPQAGVAGIPWTSSAGLKLGLWESCGRKRKAFTTPIPQKPQSTGLLSRPVVHHTVWPGRLLWNGRCGQWSLLHRGTECRVCGTQKGLNPACASPGTSLGF